MYVASPDQSGGAVLSVCVQPTLSMLTEIVGWDEVRDWSSLWTKLVNLGRLQAGTGAR